MKERLIFIAALITTLRTVYAHNEVNTEPRINSTTSNDNYTYLVTFSGAINDESHGKFMVDNLMKLNYSDPEKVQIASDVFETFWTTNYTSQEVLSVYDAASSLNMSNLSLSCRTPLYSANWTEMYQDMPVLSTMDEIINRILKPKKEILVQIASIFNVDFGSFMYMLSSGSDDEALTLLMSLNASSAYELMTIIEDLTNETTTPRIILEIHPYVVRYVKYLASTTQLEVVHSCIVESGLSAKNFYPIADKLKIDNDNNQPIVEKMQDSFTRCLGTVIANNTILTSDNCGWQISNWMPYGKVDAWPISTHVPKMTYSVDSWKLVTQNKISLAAVNFSGDGSEICHVALLYNDYNKNDICYALTVNAIGSIVQIPTDTLTEHSVHLVNVNTSSAVVIKYGSPLFCSGDLKGVSVGLQYVFVKVAPFKNLLTDFIENPTPASKSLRFSGNILATVLSVCLAIVLY